MSAPCRRTILRPARKKDTGWDTGHNQSQLRTAHEPAEEHLHVAALADRSVSRSVGRSARRRKEGRASEGAPIGNCGSRGRQPDYYVHEMVRCSESSLGASAAESGSWRDCCCCQFSDASVGDDTVSIEISAGLPSPAYVWFAKEEGYKTHCFYGVKTSWWLARTVLPSARVWTSFPRFHAFHGSTSTTEYSLGTIKCRPDYFSSEITHLKTCKPRFPNSVQRRIAWLQWKSDTTRSLFGAILNSRLLRLSVRKLLICLCKVIV